MKAELLDFWAEWCGYCKLMEPALVEIAKEYGDKLSIIKINADENSDMVKKYNIVGLPTFVLLIDGKTQSKLTGFKQKSQFKEWIGNQLK